MGKKYHTLRRWIPPLALVGAGLIVINLIWLIPTLGAIRSSASNLALEVADRTEENITLYLENSLSEVTDAAEDIALEPERTRLILGRFLERNRDFRSVVVVERTGTEEISLNSPLFGRGYVKEDHARAPHFYLALEGAPNFGEITFSEEHEPQTSVAVPIRRGSSVEKALVARLNLHALVLAAGRPSIENGHIYIVDRKGFRIIHPDANKILEKPDFSHRSIVRKVVIERKVADGLAADDTYRNEDGETVFVVGKPVPFAGLGIFVEQLRSRALASVYQVILFAIATVILGLFILIFIVRSNLRLALLNNRLRELDTIKSEFVSVAAHQLRTPLTGIKWSLSTLLEESQGFTGEQKKIADDAFVATNRLAELINDLLNVARIEEGRFGFDMRLQSLLPVMQDVSLRFKKTFSEKGIEFSVAIPDHVPHVVFDEEKIRMVLENLLDNALKYTPPRGAVSLTLSVANGDVTISVHDTGIGIPRDQSRHLFTKFFRSANAQLYQTSGTGLGLYVSKNVIDQHQGKIWFESEEEKGSTFFFSLPIAH